MIHSTDFCDSLNERMAFGGAYTWLVLERLRQSNFSCHQRFWWHRLMFILHGGGLFGWPLRLCLNTYKMRSSCMAYIHTPYRLTHPKKDIQPNFPTSLKKPLTPMDAWLVVSTHLNNISQIGSFPQVGMKITNIWNHHPDAFLLFLTKGSSNPYQRSFVGAPLPSRDSNASRLNALKKWSTNWPPKRGRDIWQMELQHVFPNCLLS